MFGATLLVLLIALPIGLAIGSVVLRAAVAWYNRMAGSRSQPVQQTMSMGYSPNMLGGDDNPNPFASPTAYGRSPVQTVGVPEPSLGWGMAIVLVSFLANLPVSLVTNLVGASSREAALAMSVLSIPINFLIGAAILKAMLPTERFGTACLIALLQFVIWLIVAVVIAVIVVIVVIASGASFG